MKATVSVQIYTAYDDGAGAVTSYLYDFSDVELTIPDLSIWKVVNYIVKRPANAVTALVATSRASNTFLGITEAGAPPNASARTISITTGGVCTFVDTDEEIQQVKISITMSDVPENDYGFDFFIDHSVDGEFAKLTANVLSTDHSTSNPVEPLQVEDQDAGIETAFSFNWKLNATDIAAGQIPATLWAGHVEQDLVSRPYNGRWLEAGIKAIMAARSASKKHGLGQWAFAIPEVASYLKGDGPLDMFVPYLTRSVVIAEP